MRRHIRAKSDQFGLQATRCQQWRGREPRALPLCHNHVINARVGERFGNRLGARGTGGTEPGIVAVVRLLGVSHHEHQCRLGNGDAREGARGEHE